ncbi:MAG: pilus assembly protein PilM [Deltaproteobacteria bacterium]|nr:pilus assembly protein PilM [Deltaproteobacteria bacterium]
MPQKILGIDIGAYSIKIASLERSFKTFEFVNFYERKIQYNEILKPEESIAVTLQGMFDDFGLTYDQIICGYPGQKTSSRVITLPFGNLKKIDQTIEFELEGYVPFDLANIVIDYHVLNSTKEMSQVLALYSLKDDFSRWLTLLQNAKLDPKIITVEEVEMLNLVCSGMIPPEGPYAILDIGHAKTNLTLCRGKKLAFVRSISSAGKQLTEAIHKKLNVPWEEAENMKIEMGSLPQEEGQVVDEFSRQVVEAMKPVLEELALHVRQALFAYQDKEGDPVEGLYLCGGTSRLPGLDRYLSQRLKQNVTHIDCTSFHFSKLGKVTSHRAMMAQGLALALRSVAAAGMPTINLRTGDFAFKGDVQKLEGTLRHIGLALGIIFCMALTYFGVKYYVLNRQLNALNKQVIGMVQKVLTVSPKQLTSPAVALKILQSEEAKVQDRITKLSDIRGVPALEILKDISTKLPPRKDLSLDVEDLNIKGERMSMVGRTDSFIAVDKIKAALESSGYLKKVTPGNVGKGVKEGEVKFEMTMDVVPEGEES